MAELDIRVRAETEQAAKKIEGFSKKVEGTTKQAGRGFQQLGGAVRSLVPGLAALAGPAAIGAVVVNVVKASKAFKDFDSARLTVNTLREATVQAGTAAFRLAQDFGTAQKIFNDANSSLKDQQSALRTVNRELRQYNLVLTDAAKAGKVAGVVSDLLQKIRKEEAFQTAVNAEAAKAYAEALNLQLLAQDTSAAGAARFLQALGPLNLVIKSIIKGGGATAGALAVTEAYSEEIGRLTGRQNKLGDAASNSEEETKKIIQQLSKVEGIKALREFEDTAESIKAVGESSEKAEPELKKLVGVYNGLAGAAGLFREELIKIKREQDEAAINQTRNVARQFFGEQTISLPKSTSLIGAEKIREVTEANKELGESISANNQLLAAGLVQGFGTIFEAISQGESPVRALTNSVKQLVVRIAAAAAAAAILNALLGGSGIIGGQSVSGFSGFFKGILGLAQGGIVSNPTPAIIGDGGPEAVIPLSQLSRLIGGGGNQQSGPLVAIARGNDLYFSNRRASQSYGRLFG
jgi:hypothetical protein